jgi:16S rRNA (cytidine1402-2'-O)-methyltransferase
MEKNSPHTIVLFESPFRVASTLEAALEALGNRRAAVCLEMTKKFESVTRGTLEELVAKFRDRNVKGEASIVIEGNRDKHAGEEEEESEESNPSFPTHGQNRRVC